MRSFATLFFFALNITSLAWAEPPTFEMHRIGTYRSEVCGVGDFTGDGKLDIIAGPFLYVAPDWKAVQVRTLKGKVDEQGNGYMYDFMNLPLDVDGDGKLDVVSCSWHERRSVWFRNVGLESGQWPEKVVEVNGNFETGDLADMDNDGQLDEIIPAVKTTVWYELGKLPDGTRGLVKHTASDTPHTWGTGAGDVNGDGRTDLLRPGAWYEAPVDRHKGTWKEHPLSLGSLDGKKPNHTPQIQVYDVNADGHNDIVTSSAHQYGIFWYEQVPGDGEPTWRQHVIDKSWSQAHSITLADLDGDGDLDLATGKRFRAHNGGDPGANDPPGVYWYELKRGSKPQWIKHVISFDKGIGAGLNIQAVDLDGDGDLDLVTTGKWGGPAWFENKRL